MGLQFILSQALFHPTFKLDVISHHQTELVASRFPPSLLVWVGKEFPGRDSAHSKCRKWDLQVPIPGGIPEPSIPLAPSHS